VARGDRGWRRTLIIDLLIACCVTGFMIVGTFGAARDGPQGPVALPPAAFVLVAAAGLSLAVRRLHPMAALGVAATAATGYLAAGYPFGPILFAVAFTAFSVGLRVPTRPAMATAAAAAVLIAGGVAFGQDLGTSWVTASGTVLAAPTWIAAACAIGFGVHAYRQAGAQSRAEAQRQQAYEERLQTAREVHDIVGHGLAAISMQAGVALHVLDRSPERTRELLTSIRDSSQHALDELRATLAVFRSDAAAGVAERAPLAGLAGLDTLVSRMADSGVPVDVSTTGTPLPLLATVDHAAYRIVQESLTNVLRHAGPTTATVRLGYAPDRLTVEVADRGRGPHDSAVPGQGVTGMRARAEGLGGTLYAGADESGGFRVRAELPLTVGVPT